MLDKIGKNMRIIFKTKYRILTEKKLNLSEICNEINIIK